MTLSQLINRNFAPSEELCRHYLFGLIISGKIKVRLSEKKTCPQGNYLKRELTIEKPELSGSMLAYEIVNSTSRFLESFSNDTNSNGYLHHIVREILCGECIEFANYLAVDYRVTILRPNPFDPRLHLLLLSNHPSQVFWLILVTMRDLTEADHIWTIDFSELIRFAFEFHSKCQIDGVTICSVGIPDSMYTSKISSIILKAILLEKYSNYL